MTQHNIATRFFDFSVHDNTSIINMTETSAKNNRET